MSEELPKDLPPDRKIRKAKLKKQTAEIIKVAVDNLKQGKVSEPINPALRTTEDSPVYGQAGRISKLTPENIKKILDGVAAGGTIKMAAGAAGVNVDTCYHWLKLAREYEANNNPTLLKYYEFKVSLQKAEQDCNMFYAEKLKERAAVGDVKAIAFHLERRVPEAYAPKGNVTIDNSQHLHMSDEAVKQLTDAWMKKRTDSTEQIVDTIVTKIDDDVNT